MRALFDLSFKRFVAPSIVKIVYILVMIATVVVYLFFVVAAFRSSTALGIATLIIIGPIAALLYLIMARVFLESVIAQIRTAENTRDLLVAMQGGQGSPPAPPLQPGPFPAPPGPFPAPPAGYGPYGSPS